MKDPTFTPVYAYVYPAMCEIARSKGYALALHGTMQRDFDLIAVPWVDEAVDAPELVAALEQVAGGYVFAHPTLGREPTPKPHGRMSWVLILDNGAFIDLGVMPKVGR